MQARPNGRSSEGRGAAHYELNYTWSSFINDSDDILGGQTNNTLPAVPFNFKLDRGRSGFDFPHRFVGNFVYEFPQVFRNRAVLGRVLGGWMLNGIYTAQSGVAYTILNGNNALGILPGQIATVHLSQRAHFNPAGAPFTAGGPVAGQPLPRYVALPTNSGQIGSLGRNTERTGGINSMDAAAVKTTRLWSESSALQLRWEVFNVFNRRNFTAIPLNTVSTSTNLTRLQNLGETNVGRAVDADQRAVYVLSAAANRRGSETGAAVPGRTPLNRIEFPGSNSLESTAKLAYNAGPRGTGLGSRCTRLPLNPRFDWEVWMHAPNSFRRMVHLFALGLLLAATAVNGQTIYGTLTGHVFDPTGALVPETKITIKNLDTGAVREVMSDATGAWIARALPLGRYSVEFFRQGFERVVRQPIQVEGAVERAIDVTLNPGATTEVVSVVAEAPLIQTTQAQVSKGVETRRILELPGLNTQAGLALLMPGAAPNNNGRPGSGFTMNGGRSRSNNFTIDGANNNDQSLMIARQNVAPEYLAEFRIITNNFSAEFGRNAGSVVQQLTKSGTNEFHGNVRWTWSGNGYDALTTAQQRSFTANKETGLSDYLALRRSRGVQVNNAGLVSVGGPIMKDKAFFFTGYDRTWNRSTRVPTANALSSTAVARLDANASRFAPGVVDFIKNSWPTANDPTSRGTLNVAAPAGVTFADGSTSLALPLNLYNRGGISYAQSFWRWMQKGDIKLTDNDTLTGRLLIDNNKNPGAPTGIPGQEVGNLTRNINTTLNYTKVFSPATLNEARATYGRRNASFPENLDAQITITGALPVLGNQNFPQWRVDNVYELTDNLSITRGRHTLRIGANAMRYDLNSFFAPATKGVLSYPSMADLLFDRNASWTQYAGNALTPARTYEVGAFFQDDFRMSTTLTLNLGARYEYTSAPLGYFSNAKPDINNWAPRVGFAYAPRWSDGILGWLSGNGRMSIRGGYAIAYDQVFQNILLNNSRNYPRGVTVAAPPVSGQRLYVKENRPAAPTPDQYRGDPKLLPIRLFSPDQRIKQPIGQQYSLGIERQILANFAFRVFYIGSRGSGLVREVETNLGFTKVAVDNNPSLLQPVVQAYGMKLNPAGTQYRVDPTRGSILVGGPLAMSTYHSLQTTLEKRYSSAAWGGAIFELNYTYSSFINDSDDILGGQTNNTLPAVPFNYKLDRGRSGYDFPHRAVGNFIYEFPKVFSDQAILGRALGGWTLSGIVTGQSGVAYTILNSNNALGILPGQISTVELSQRPTFNPAGAPGTAGAIVAGQPLPRYIANSTNSGIIGNLGRNTERTGNTVNFDAALAKNTRLWSESTALQLRLDATNLFNRRNFDVIPARNASNTTNLTLFQNLGQTDVGGRALLITARVIF